MGGKYLLILFLILASCETALQTIPTSKYQPAVEIETPKPVQNITSEIKCPAGEKLCEKECIPEKQCCTDNDCETGTCENGECATPKECALGEEYKNGKCQCTKDKTYCDEQKKCIGKDKCCRHTSCDSFERCVPTNWKTSLCIKIEEKKLCKILADFDKTELYTVKGTDFRIMPTDWWNDKSVTFEINNESIRIKQNETVALGNATLFHEGVEIIGGYCKEDE